MEKPYQQIFFGAPGTGKSYELNKLAKLNFENNIERVTFHPNYMYGNFVGAYKPSVVKNNDKDRDDTISYRYVPGPLIRQLVEAYKNPDEDYLLIIEEINRANVSVVFGDTFQLLDRREDGFSQYSISTSEDLRNYLEDVIVWSKKESGLKDTLKEALGSSFENLTFPRNFYIWATMNSADQGVMPMDTAFKRRWEFKYIGIDEGVDENFENYKFKVGPGFIANWNDFRVEVNKRLEKHIPEDKLMGPYFIPKSILESDTVTLTKAIRDKVLIYLYDDAAKPFRNQLFEPEKSRKFSDLRKQFDEDALGIFKEKLNIIPERVDYDDSDEDLDDGMLEDIVDS